MPGKQHGKDLLQMAGDYTVELMVGGLIRFLREYAPQLDTSPGARGLEGNGATKARAAELLGALPQRPPTFCIGCPERPVLGRPGGKEMAHVVT